MNVLRDQTTYFRFFRELDEIPKEDDLGILMYPEVDPDDEDYGYADEKIEVSHPDYPLVFYLHGEFDRLFDEMIVYVMAMSYMNKRIRGGFTFKMPSEKDDL